MGTFELISKHGNHEQVVFCHDPSVGLKAIIAIHNTSLGPALGGTRMWNYKNEEEALVDVLRLSKGMTYKAAAAGLNLGGGKAVIIGDPKKDKSEGLFRAFGQFVNSLNGRYITAEDVGTNVTDMEHIFMETPWVTGIPKGFGGSGDPSPYTAHGVLMGIKAAAKEKFGTDSLKGLKVAVQGLGNVGSNLVKYLIEEGAKTVVADIDQGRVKMMHDQFGCEVSNPDAILTVECDIFAPCALGAVVNDNTITKLKTKVIAGGANNVLAEARHGDQLRELGILYTPDYVINAGGLMNVFVELEGYSPDRAFDKTRKVYDNCMKVFEIAKRDNIGTHVAADRLAEERITTIGRLKQRHPGKSSRAFSTLREVYNR
ncbi:Glu/Leu/Phe/Val dehydrogenase dimerization domain-containing protein [Bdellovibrio sp. HCB337]|uniref:Glu/Leu/Phe/Val dehydrogenase dimerization domain-containing protein n=1 Tax=Bdellovibrio sp. HCB337 TaxID=3394358 RepID=UPI0039A64A7E